MSNYLSTRIEETGAGVVVGQDFHYPSLHLEGEPAKDLTNFELGNEIELVIKAVVKGKNLTERPNGTEVKSVELEITDVKRITGYKVNNDGSAVLL